VVALDPEGSVYRSYFYTGEPKAEGASIIEGVGIGRIPGNYDGAVLDEVVTVPDADAVRMVHRLARREGLFLGGCSGMVVAGAVAWAKANRQADRELNIVVILSDTGRNYISKLFNAEWLASQNLPVPE
jgi:cysteine synthase A